MSLEPPRRPVRSARAVPRALASLAIVLGAAAAPLTLAAPSEAGTDGGAPRAAVGDAGAAPRDAGGARDAGPASPPDPPPLVEREQWVFDLRYDQGDVFLVGVSRVDLGAPRPTPRMMGRFALELWEGDKLVERVRFDFPLLGVPEPEDAGYRGPPRLTAKLRTRTGVMFPVTKRGQRLELVDRSRDVRYALPWPPAASPVVDAGPEPLRR